MVVKSGCAFEEVHLRFGFAVVAPALLAAVLLFEPLTFVAEKQMPMMENGEGYLRYEKKDKIFGYKGRSY